MCSGYTIHLKKHIFLITHVQPKDIFVMNEPFRFILILNEATFLRTFLRTFMHVCCLAVESESAALCTSAELYHKVVIRSSRSRSSRSRLS